MWNTSVVKKTLPSRGGINVFEDRRDSKVTTVRTPLRGSSSVCRGYVRGGHRAPSVSGLFASPSPLEEIENKYRVSKRRRRPCEVHRAGFTAWFFFFRNAAATSPAIVVHFFFFVRDRRWAETRRGQNACDNGNNNRERPTITMERGRRTNLTSDLDVRSVPLSGHRSSPTVLSLAVGVSVRCDRPKSPLNTEKTNRRITRSRPAD